MTQYYFAKISRAQQIIMESFPKMHHTPLAYFIVSIKLKILSDEFDRLSLNCQEKTFTHKKRIKNAK